MDEIIAELKHIRENASILSSTFQKADFDLPGGSEEEFDRIDRYFILAEDAAVRGRMWLGKLLGGLGSANPYPESMNPKSDAIEPLSDIPKVESIIHFEDGMSDISKIKEMRRFIEVIILEPIEAVMQATAANLQGMESIAAMNVIAGFVESKLWLGQILGTQR